MPKRNSVGWTGGAVASLATATGLLVGLRSIIAAELPRPSSLLGLPHLPREGLGILWSVRASWPVDVQASALDRLVAVIGALFLAAVGVAALNAFVVLAEASASRRSELAVRSALGAPAAKVVLMLVRELRSFTLAGVSFGLVGGIAVGGMLRAAWPGPLVLGAAADGAVSDVLLVLIPMLAVLGLAHVAIGARMGEGPSAIAALRSGTRSTADPGAVFFRRAVPALHTAVAGTVVVSAIALAGALGSEAAAVNPIAPVRWVVAGTAQGPESWERLTAALDSIPGIAAESLASPGALIGLGIRDHVTAQCGPCFRGGMPQPLWGALAEHHSVGPGFFALVGMPLTEGRDFRDSDGPESERVAIVNETFARTSFHKGEPLGRKIKLGSSLQAWYTVIGVVADAPAVAVGAYARPHESVWVSARQHPSRSASVLLAGRDDGVAEAVERMEAMGLRPAEPVPLSRVRDEAGAALAWMRDVAIVLGLLTVVLAGYGVRTTALQVTRRRATELSIRRVVGADDGRVVLHVLGERARAGAWGVAGMVFFGTMAVAFLRNAAALDAPGPRVYALVASGLLAVALVSSLQAAREATRVEPAALLD